MLWRGKALACFALLIGNYCVLWYYYNYYCNQRFNSSHTVRKDSTVNQPEQLTANTSNFEKLRWTSVTPGAGDGSAVQTYPHNETATIQPKPSIHELHIVTPGPLYPPQDDQYVTWVYSPAKSLMDKLDYFNDYLLRVRLELVDRIKLDLRDYRGPFPCLRNFTKYPVLRGMDPRTHSFQFRSSGLSRVYFMSWRDSPSEVQDIGNVVSRLPVKHFYKCVKGTQLVTRFHNFTAIQNFLTRQYCEHDCSDNWEDLVQPRANFTMLFETYNFHNFNDGCRTVLNTSGSVHTEVLHSMDVVVNAVVDRSGIVLKNGSLLFPYTYGVENVGVIEDIDCIENNRTFVHVPEVFISTQRPVSRHAKYNFAHILSDMLTKVAPYIPFLTANPQIPIHAPIQTGFISSLYQVYGLRNPIIAGVVSANVTYLPHGSGINNIFLTTAISAQQFYRTKMSAAHGASAQLWDTVLVIKRTSRSINNETFITELLSKEAQKRGFRFYIFDDQNLPAFPDAMLEFHRARLVIGPHGAGLASLLFMKPGSAVIELMCTPYWPRNTFTNLALKLGLRYYVTMTTAAAATSRRCNDEGVTFDLDELQDILRFIFDHVFPVMSL